MWRKERIAEVLIEAAQERLFGKRGFEEGFGMRSAR
jgi:hypothetical protein